MRHMGSILTKIKSSVQGGNNDRMCNGFENGMQMPQLFS